MALRLGPTLAAERPEFFENKNFSGPKQKAEGDAWPGDSRPELREGAVRGGAGPRVVPAGGPRKPHAEPPRRAAPKCLLLGTAATPVASLT